MNFTKLVSAATFAFLFSNCVTELGVTDDSSNGDGVLAALSAEDEGYKLASEKGCLGCHNGLEEATLVGPGYAAVRNHYTSLEVYKTSPQMVFDDLVVSVVNGSANGKRLTTEGPTCGPTTR